MALDPKELPPVRMQPRDPNNLNISRDEFIAKRRKQNELRARMAVEQDKIEKELGIEEPKKSKKKNKLEV